MGNKSFLCLSCLNEKHESFIESSKKSSIINAPLSQIEIDPLNNKKNTEKIMTKLEEESKIKEEINNKSLYLSFKNGNTDNIQEEKSKTTSFFSIAPDQSFVKSIKDDEKFRISCFTRSSNYRIAHLENIYKLISAEYNDFEQIYDDNKSELKLKIYLKSYIRAQSRINIFRTEYIAPCSPKEYVSFANNLEIQKELDHAANQYYVVKKINEKTEILYLSYKKTIITSPRDFLYLKTHGEIQKDNKKFYCILGRSIDLEEFGWIEGNIRCEIINSGYVIEEYEGKSLIRTYSEFDFKLNVPLFIVKTFSISESKKFVNNSIQKLKEILQENN